MAIFREGAKLGTQELILETGRMATLADGSVLVQYGESQVLCTAVGGAAKDLGFFPLTVNYVENKWAAGSIPGGYFRREGKPSTKATLTSRLIDRPCRPLFADGYENETQLIAWIVSADGVNDTDVLGITGCSAALMLSSLPWNGPLAGVRIGRIDGEFVANPTFEQREQSDLDIVIAVSEDAIVMVEGEAKEQPVEIMLEALEFGRNAVQDVLKLQREMAKKLGKEKMEVTPKVLDADVVAAVKKAVGNRMLDAVMVPDKTARGKATRALRDDVVAAVAESFPEQEKVIKSAFDKLKKTTVRGKTAKENKRIDGRGPKDIRKITCEIDVVPMAHGSALFTRGDTQALVSSTLGTERDSLREETMQGQVDNRFYLHYNFPPFSVNEARFLRSTSRREIGHGMLAERALAASLPDLQSEFPYTVRVVSDILGSNGSSSMASVCGGSLSLMAAGVPVKTATAGIAMGLIKEGDDLVILSDILGDEDHLGDMDFKVCGTAKGITAFQLDTKIAGIGRDVMTNALKQANDGIQHILGIMNDTISEARTELSENAPRITHIKIPTDSIGAIIGPGGKTIRGIEATTGATLTISDDGTVAITSANGLATQQALEIIKGITAVPETGKNYMGTVKKIVDFGAFIEILPGKEGLCHISELTEGRVKTVDEVLKEGDECLVKVLNVERNGKIRLSRKAALGEDVTAS